jgi:hypothetical protein
MGLVLLFLSGVLAGGAVTSLLLMLVRKWVRAAPAIVLAAFAFLMALTWLAGLSSFSIAERWVIAEVVPQWEAQGHLDNGPSAFVAIAALAMPFVIGVMSSSVASSIVFMIRRRSR